MKEYTKTRPQSNATKICFHPCKVVGSGISGRLVDCMLGRATQIFAALHGLLTTFRSLTTCHLAHQHPWSHHAARQSEGGFILRNQSRLIRTRRRLRSIWSPLLRVQDLHSLCQKSPNPQSGPGAPLQPLNVILTTIANTHLACIFHILLQCLTRYPRFIFFEHFFISNAGSI